MERSNCHNQDPNKIYQVYHADGSFERRVDKTIDPGLERELSRRQFGRNVLGLSTVITGTIVTTSLAFEKSGIFDEEEPDFDQETPPQTTTWELVAKWEDTYWGIVEEHYNFSTPSEIYRFIESNIQNIDAEREKRKKEPLEKNSPYMKEPLISGDKLKISDPTPEDTDTD